MTLVLHLVDEMRHVFSSLIISCICVFISRSADTSDDLGDGAVLGEDWTA